MISCLWEPNRKGLVCSPNEPQKLSSNHEKNILLYKSLQPSPSIQAVLVPQCILGKIGHDKIGSANLLPADKGHIDKN